jgi:hypothetical protein
MRDATRRGLRTAGQLAVTLLANGAAFGLLQAFGVPVTLEQYGAATAVLLPFITVGLNALEDAGAIPALGKAPASDGADPVPAAATAEPDYEATSDDSEHPGGPDPLGGQMMTPPN